jgi:hypothetical protein
VGAFAPGSCVSTGRRRRRLLTGARECDYFSQEYVPEYEVGLVWEDQMPPSAAAAHGFAPELVEPGITSSS